MPHQAERRTEHTLLILYMRVLWDLKKKKPKTNQTFAQGVRSRGRTPRLGNVGAVFSAVTSDLLWLRHCRAGRTFNLGQEWETAANSLHCSSIALHVAHFSLLVLRL